MKTLSLLLIPICLLAACKKETTVAPKTGTQSQTSSQTTTSQTSTSSSTSGQSSPTPPAKPTGTNTPVVDTIPDQAMLKLKLVKDSINSDETILLFDHTASAVYNVDYDAPYLQGYGQESLSSLSSDGRDLVMNTIPYKQGVPVGLDVNVKSDGTYSLQVSYLKSIPAGIQVIVKDNYAKDSLDVRTGSYKFNVVKSDAASYGANRFSVVFRNKAH